jgi:hypothetical protein
MAPSMAAMPYPVLETQSCRPWETLGKLDWKRREINGELLPEDEGCMNGLVGRLRLLAINTKRPISLTISEEEIPLG